MTFYLLLYHSYILPTLQFWSVYFLNTCISSTLSVHSCYAIQVSIRSPHQIALPITSPPHNQTDHSNIEIGSLYLCYTFLSHSGEAPIAFRIETKCLPWSRRSDPSFLMRLTFVSECLPRDLLSHILIAIVSSHFWLTSSPEEFSPYLRPLCLCPFPSTPP